MVDRPWGLLSVSEELKETTGRRQRRDSLPGTTPGTAVQVDPRLTPG